MTVPIRLQRQPVWMILVKLFHAKRLKERGRSQSDCKGSKNDGRGNSSMQYLTLYGPNQNAVASWITPLVQCHLTP